MRRKNANRDLELRQKLKEQCDNWMDAATSLKNSSEGAIDLTTSVRYHCYARQLLDCYNEIQRILK